MFVVNERQQAIVIRFGQIQDVKSEPGLYFKLPFGFMDADSVQYIQDQALRFDLDDIRVQVSGGKFYEVDAFVVHERRRHVQLQVAGKDAARRHEVLGRLAEPPGVLM